MIFVKWYNENFESLYDEDWYFEYEWFPINDFFHQFIVKIENWKIINWESNIFWRYNNCVFVSDELNE